MSFTQGTLVECISVPPDSGLTQHVIYQVGKTIEQGSQVEIIRITTKKVFAKILIEHLSSKHFRIPEA